MSAWDGYREVAIQRPGERVLFNYVHENATALKAALGQEDAEAEPANILAFWLYPDWGDRCNLRDPGAVPFWARPPKLLPERSHDSNYGLRLRAKVDARRGAYSNVDNFNGHTIA